MPYAATAISVLALVFTIAAFWWLHARRGSVTATTPRVYAFTDAMSCDFRWSSTTAGLGR